MGDYTHDTKAAITGLAAELDRIDPHWADVDRIDTTILDAGTYNACVIGQSFFGARGERGTPDHLGAAVAWRDRHFATDPNRVYFATNDEEWIEEIEKRRGHGTGELNGLHLTTTSRGGHCRVVTLTETRQGVVQPARKFETTYASEYNACQAVLAHLYGAAPRGGHSVREVETQESQIAEAEQEVKEAQEKLDALRSS